MLSHIWGYYNGIMIHFHFPEGSETNSPKLIRFRHCQFGDWLAQSKGAVHKFPSSVSDPKMTKSTWLLILTSQSGGISY